MKYTNVLLVFILFLVSCEDDTEDYRERYCGDYTFEVINYFYQPATNFNDRDTSFFEGTIFKKLDTDSILVIIYSNRDNVGAICGGDTIYGAQIEPLIDVYGILTYDRVKSCSNQSGFSGSFIKVDSINFTINTGGLGSSSGQIVKGIRK